MEGLILAQGERWRHASYMQVERSDAGCLHPALRSGERVSNTWATCLEDWDNSGKLGLIPDVLFGSHGPISKWFFRFEMGPRPISLLVG
jgi:hypothetical protein